MVDVTCSDVVGDGVRIVYFPGAARNSLNTSALIIFRVAVCSTLKTIKSLILNALHGALSVSSWKKFTKKSKLLWNLNAIG